MLCFNRTLHVRYAAYAQSAPVSGKWDALGNSPTSGMGHEAGERLVPDMRACAVAWRKRWADAAAAMSGASILALCVAYKRGACESVML